MIKPLGERVLLEVPEVKEEKTQGGLFVPDTAKEKLCAKKRTEFFFFISPQASCLIAARRAFRWRLWTKK